MAKTKDKKQQEKAVKNKSAGAGKRTTQTKEKTDEGKGKGAKSAPAVRKSCTVKGNKQKLSSPASTRQRSQTSRSTPVANAQSKDTTTSLFKFRRYKKKEGKKKVRHPKLIVEENETEYGFMGFTEDSKSGHHKNIELTKNPKKGDNRPAYIRKELRYDITDNFSEVLENYNLSEEDKKAIIEYLNKRKKKEVTHCGSH